MLSYDLYDWGLDVGRSGPGAEGGVRRKAGRSEEGVLDSVVTATLQGQVIRGWDVESAEQVREVYNVLESEDGFQALVERPQEFAPLPGKKSALSAGQVAHLVEAGVLERKRREDERVVNVVKAFTVPKPSGKVRLVVDASNVGDAQVDPPPVSLPTVADVKQLVASYSWVVQLDGKSWFYQIAARRLRSFFAVRTVLGLHWLVVLAMGWSWSVWIAQTLAVAIAQRAVQLAPSDVGATHAEYIDNFIVAGHDVGSTALLVSALKAAADECGAVLKPSSEDPVTTEVLLGIQCDFTAKTVCVKPAWIVSFRSLSSAFLLSPGRYDVRTAWKLLGNVLWGMRVLGVRQLTIPYLKLWMGRQAQKLTSGRSSWSDRCDWWPLALRDLRTVVRVICANSPVHVSLLEASSEETLWADASLTGGAYILEFCGVELGFRWGADWDGQRIHVLEAEALRRGVARWLRVRRADESLRLMTDNMLVYHGLTNKKAKGVIFSRILETICASLVGIVWTVHWVPSAEQKADTLSRLFV